MKRSTRGSGRRPVSEFIIDGARAMAKAIYASIDTSARPCSTDPVLMAHHGAWAARCRPRVRLSPASQPVSRLNTTRCVQLQARQSIEARNVSTRSSSARVSGSGTRYGFHLMILSHDSKQSPFTASLRLRSMKPFKRLSAGSSSQLSCAGRQRWRWPRSNGADKFESEPCHRGSRCPSIPREVPNLKLSQIT